MTLAYALAGADCIDVAADPAVITAAQSGLDAAQNLIREAQAKGYGVEAKPWLMVSLNDGEDPHFRKAEFDPARCPEACPRPCEAVCPVKAIVFESSEFDQEVSGSVGQAKTNGFSGVVESLCYGCGRCLTICPIQNITARSYVSTPAAVAPLVLAGVDAVEIHTQIGRLQHFERLWQAILPYVNQLKLISISCPDGEGLIDYLWSLYDLISPLPGALVWQTDGRPMSGDIGDGATRAAVRLGQKVLAAGLPGYVQLAGGTNRHTVSKLRAMGLVKASAGVNIGLNLAGLNPDSFSAPSPHVAGVAYGSYARSILAPILDVLEADLPSALLPESADQLAVDSARSAALPVLQPVGMLKIDGSDAVPQLSLGRRVMQLEENPRLLWQAVAAAHALVADLKQPSAEALEGKVNGVEV